MAALVAFSVAHHKLPPSTGKPPRIPACSRAASTWSCRGRSVRNSWKKGRYTAGSPHQWRTAPWPGNGPWPWTAGQPPPTPGAPWRPGKRWRSGRTGLRWSRCCCWPFPGGCAAPGLGGIERRRVFPFLSRVCPTMRPGSFRMCLLVVAI